jgi:hypothetical protein
VRWQSLTARDDDEGSGAAEQNASATVTGVANQRLQLQRLQLQTRENTCPQEGGLGVLTPDTRAPPAYPTYTSFADELLVCRPGGREGICAFASAFRTARMLHPISAASSCCDLPWSR